MKRVVPLSVLVAGVMLYGCDVNRALEQVSEARHSAADLTVQFTKAADAGNLAVMADTDEASQRFAAEARARADAAESDVAAVRARLTSLNFSEELRLLDAFAGHFTTFRKLDATILELAVANTNLKAQQLSFGAAQDSIDALAEALARLAPAKDSDGAWHVRALAAGVLARAREVQALQARHIAEPEEPAMRTIELRMSTAEKGARDELAALAPLVHQDARTELATASGAFERLMAVNRQVLELSHRNTNVRSLAMALTEKRTVVTACEDSLRALEAALAKRIYRGR
jgi:hypothetical protein